MLSWKTGWTKIDQNELFCAAQYPSAELPKCSCVQGVDKLCWGNDACTNWRNERECPPSCQMGSKCCNSQLQSGQWKSSEATLQVFHIEGKGWCLRAGKAYKKGELVVPYCGEMFLEGDALDKERSDEYKVAVLVTRRQPVATTQMATNTGEKASRIETTVSMSTTHTVYHLDASKKGSLARFSAHNCGGGNMTARQL
mmetsp:Transcript_10897/g.21899  ORF Transcript_10897/g.21899 Transcript_10897/m.21899 type:complete len:198 (+) Transcript_10897:3-596(+)